MILKIHSAKNPEKKDNLKVRYEPKDGNIPIEADRNRMTQVISNLLNNAVKFTNEGTITIKTERKDDRVFVSIKDTGRGIDAEIMPRLFSKFVLNLILGLALVYLSPKVLLKPMVAPSTLKITKTAKEGQHLRLVYPQVNNNKLFMNNKLYWLG